MGPHARPAGFDKQWGEGVSYYEFIPGYILNGEALAMAGCTGGSTRRAEPVARRRGTGGHNKKECARARNAEEAIVSHTIGPRRATGALSLAVMLVCLAAGSAFAVTYTSTTSGNWQAAATWGGSGIPTRSDDAVIANGTTVTINDSRALCNNLTINSGGTLSCATSSISDSVLGNWANGGTATLTAGTIVLGYLTTSTGTQIGGSSATSFYQLEITKDALATTVTMNANVTAAANVAGALKINVGTLSTNGSNLTVNGGTSASVNGNASANGKLDINTGGTVTIYYLDQNGYVTATTGLGRVAIGTGTTVVITGLHRIAPASGPIEHICNITGGTINYTNTGTDLDFDTGWMYSQGSVNSGWQATGGTATFYGNTTATWFMRWTASGTAVVIFAGGTNSTMSLHSFGGGPVPYYYSFADLRIQKNSGYGLTVTASPGGRVNQNFVATNLLVKPGNTLTLKYSGYNTGNGWSLVNVVDSGTITHYSNSGTYYGDIIGNTSWTGSGNYTQSTDSALKPTLTAPGGMTAGAVTTIGRLVVSGGTGLNCASYTQNDGVLAVTGNVTCTGSFTQAAGADTAAISGTTGLTCGALAQSGGILSVPNGSIDGGSGAMGIAGTVTTGGGVTGGAYTQSAGSLAAGGGVTCGACALNGGTLTVGGDLACTSVNQTAGVLTANGNVTCSGAYSGSQGITFAGTGSKTFTGASIVTGNLTINKTSGGGVAAGCDLMVKNALTVTAGTFSLGAHRLTLGDASSSGSVAVNTGGTFSVVGSAYANGRLTTTNVAYPYSFNAASGSMTNALYAQFDGMNASGLSIVGLIDINNNFSNCVFDHGSMGGTMLKIENASNINIVNTGFSGSAGYNIEKIANNGRVTVTTAAGNRWGEAFENDPNSRIDWLGADVGPTAIVAPVGSYDTNAVITPQVKVKNYSTMAVMGAKVVFKIDSTAGNTIYADTLTKSIAPNAESTWSFKVWSAIDIARTYSTFCSTYVAGDTRPSNNVIRGSFTLTSAPPGWYAKTPMPAGAKAIKDGGWLAYDASKARIYASRGQKQPDFFAYAPGGDSWKALAPWQPGIEGKLPGKGSAGCADGNGVVYATKGNNKSGFWKYYANGDSWRQKKDVPLGVSNKKVKGGTDIVWAYKGSVGSPYLLKGYKNEFYRYDTGGDSWQTLAPAPVGVNQKWDKGSWLAYNDVSKKIYAFKAKYHEFFRYSPDGDSWSAALRAMPVPGSAGSRKAKDGCCGTYINGSIYALKGANTREFWKYSVATDSWAEKETIPTGTMKKKVKSGADIVTAGLSLYATKGNKSNELWQYVPGAFLFEAPRHDGVLAGRTVMAQGMSISPNPLVGGFAVLHYSLPQAGAAELSVYNVVGQSVMARKLVAGRSGIVNLDLRHLSNGVYLVKFSSEGFANSQKLVVQR